MRAGGKDSVGGVIGLEELLLLLDRTAGEAGEEVVDKVGEVVQECEENVEVGVEEDGQVVLDGYGVWTEWTVGNITEPNLLLDSFNS